MRCCCTAHDRSSSGTGRSSRMSGPILRLVGISKTYSSESGATVLALENLHLTVNEREFVTVIGPTGCGKTTLLNIIAGLDSQDGGEVLLAEGLKPGTNMPCVFQHYTLFPWRTLLQNVAFGLEMRGAPRTEMRTAAFDLLSKVGLTGFENAYPHELSGGMRQRAAIAQALASQPRMLLMDEPFGAVDDMTRKDLQRMIVELWQHADLTILFVTHNIDEAIAVGDRVIVLSDRPGRVTKEFAIDMPRPRDGMSEPFTDLFVEIRRVSGSAAVGQTAEPTHRVSQVDFQNSLAVAENTGFIIADRPRIRRCRSVLLKKRKI